MLVDRCENDTDADAVLLDNTDAAQLRSATSSTPGTGIAILLRRRQRHPDGNAYKSGGTGCCRTDSAIAGAQADRRRNLRRHAREFLRKNTQIPDAIVTSSGLILLGLVQALREANLRFPEDVALAGFDDMPWTRVVTPAITVMAQPTYDIGHSAIELLLARIAQPEQAVRRIVLRGNCWYGGRASVANIAADPPTRARERHPPSKPNADTRRQA